MMIYTVGNVVKRSALGDVGPSVLRTLLEGRHVHLNPVFHRACFASATEKRNLHLDSAGTRADRWQEMSLRSFCRASFPALLADLLDPLADLLDLCVGL